MKYPQFQWMFNKLTLSQTQGIKAAPHGIHPEEFPCFSKPIYNLYGLGAQSCVMHEWYEHAYRPGHMWMQFLKGKHRSWDFLVEKGEVLWIWVMIPYYRSGSISKWITEANPPSDISKLLMEWITHFFPTYSGCVNIETLGDKIIECVPRMSTQFIDFFGDNYLDSVASLYREERVSAPGKTKEGLSKILRTQKHNARRIYYISNKKGIRELEESVLSIKLPWYEGRPLYEISDDPYSYRLAIVNGEDEKEVDGVLNQIKRYIRYEE